jgi:hypothetical protein
LPGPYPWIGAASFVDLDAPRPERLVPPTREEAFWRRFCPSIFAPQGKPTLFARLVLHITVTPMAFVTFLNLHYQFYLSHLLHTTPQAWLSHAVCIPANVALLFYALALYAPMGSSAPPFVNGGLLLAPLLCVWYLSMAAKLRNPLWGAAACAIVGVLFLAGNDLARVAVDPAAPSAWSSTPWYLHPLFLIGGVSVVQASGHLFEDRVPPRANRTDGWISMRDFVWGGDEVPLWKRLTKLSWTPIGTLWGALDEWYSSAKLLPLFLLQTMWALGYKPEQRRQFHTETLEVLRRGNPAMDWVGTGGGAFVIALERR